MSDSDDRAWIAKGAQVAVYRHVSGGRDTVHLTTVARLTTTQIVLAGGQRYRRDSLRPVGATNNVWDTNWSELMPPGDQQVRHARARARLVLLDRRISEIIRNLGHNATPEELVAAVDAIDQAATQIRAQIIELTKED